MNHPVVIDKLFTEIYQLIESARTSVARKINASLVVLYWKIGSRINQEILSEKRASYGENIIKQLANQLSKKYGKGFDQRSVFRMVKFAKNILEEKLRLAIAMVKEKHTRIKQFTSEKE